MATIVTRAGKGSPLTNQELDNNFSNLNTDKAELSGATFTGEIVANAGIALGDNDKATFGTGDDLQIYHDGSNSIITDTGTGYLNLSTNGAYILLTNADNNSNLAYFEKGGGSHLYWNGSSGIGRKLATTATGIDVTGTATMDGLTVGDNQFILAGNGADLKIGHDGTGSIIRAQGSPLYIDANGTTFRGYSPYTKHMDIASNGDISFYEDTGTTPKLFWDASAERLGLGTTSPQRPFHINIGTDNTAARFQSTDTEVALEFIDPAGTAYFRASGDYIKMGATQSDSLTILDGGNVGIGTAIASSFHASANNLVIGSGASSDNTGLTIFSNENASGSIHFADSTTSADAYRGFIFYTHGSSNHMAFGTNAIEAARIDASQNFLVGTTNTAAGAGNSATGISLRGGTDNRSFFSVNQNYVMHLNRKGNSGNILEFAQDGTGVGSWMSRSGVVSTIILDPRTGGRGLSAGTNSIVPTDKDGTLSNGATDIGEQNFKFRDLYLSTNIYQGATTPSSSAAGVTTEAVGRAKYSRGSGTGGFGHLSFINGNGAVGSVVTSGSATAYNTSSDQRLKENIADADDAGSKIDSIQVRKFDWKADGSHQDYGMIAQELQTVAPEAVSVPEDSEEMMGVDYSKLVPLMLKEIQSLRQRVASLEE